MSVTAISQTAQFLHRDVALARRKDAWMNWMCVSIVTLVLHLIDYCGTDERIVVLH